MMRLLLIVSLASMMFSIGLFGEESGKVPIIYSTDLFHPYDDPDDHFDLATLFALPEFDIRAIVLDLGHLQRKAPGDLPVKQLFQITGRTAPLLIGLQHPLRYPEDKALDEFNPETPSAILRLLKESKSKVMLVATGSMRDFAAAYNRDPDLFRAKVGRLYIVDGNSGGSELQWNPRLDPQAYLRLMQSDLPIYWAPGFGGPETLADLAAGKLGTREYQAYWKFRHGDLMESLPRPLQNYFLYALGRKEPSREDPVEYLKRADLEEPLRSQQWSQTRHMWSTVALYDAAGRSIYRKGDSWVALRGLQPGYERANLYEFARASVLLDRDLRATLKVPGNKGTFRVLRVNDLANYQAAMLGSLRGLLAETPIRQATR
ncbi:MAG: nucleoside hydrolase [Acidobacteria bacterium]|nr:nucleoside hydrolase [Acidobacteriota bacterium]